MKLLTAKHSARAITALVLISLMSVANASAEPPSATPASTSNPEFLEIRCRGANQFGDNLFSRGIEEFRKSHPEVAIKYGWPNDSPLKVAEDLATGRLELALLMGPVYRPNGTAAVPGSVRRDLLMELLENSQCEYAVIGRSAMAVVVHPQNPLQEIDQAQAEKILQRTITSWSAFNQEDHPIRIMGDERTSLITQECANARVGTLRTSQIPKGIEQLASDPWAIGFLCIDKRLAASGLKILPVRPNGDKEAVRPSPENAVSGRYPFHSYVLLASRPKAPALALEFRRTMEDPQLDRGWGSWWLPKLDYTLPGEACEETWPLPDEKAASPVVTGAVAVLPLEPLNAEFVMVGSSQYAAYEQAVVDAIAKDGRLSMVDRTELARVLKEHRLKLAGGDPQPPRAIITADVLVLSSVATVDSRAYLLVQAVHAATTSCLGRMKLPIDSARPEEFMASIAPKTTQWWPGVLRNLTAALDRPVWTFLPPALPNHASPELTEDDRALLQRVGDVQASLEEKLLADPRVFYARPGMIPDAQQEVLMGLLGISRPASSRFTPMADYLLQGDILGKGKIRLRVLRGSDLQTLCETTVEPSAPAATAGDWIFTQLAGFVERPTRMDGKRPIAMHSAAAAQAALELQQIPELRKQLEAFRHAAHERWRAAEQWNDPDVYLPEDKKELDRREEEINRRYQRATQLDPTCEATAYEAIVAAGKLKRSGYTANRRIVDVFTRFLDTFPNSKHAATLAHNISNSYASLARYLEEDLHKYSRNAGVPSGLEQTKLIKEYRRGAVVYMIRHVGFVRSSKPKLDASDSVLKDTLVRFQEYLDRYVTLDVAESEFEEVAAEYSRTLDLCPEIMPPGDFQRLHYLAAKKKKDAFVDVLLAMQRRWPDPNDVHWKLGKDQAIDDLCELFEADPRRTSFYQWLRGKRGIGDLPWEGYDSKEKEP